MSKLKHIIVGMSGGVDSSVTALILKQQGHQVTGVFMRNWEADQNDPYCSIDQDQKDAHAVCQKLNIPFQTVNFAEKYWQKVFQLFLDEYAAGRTPNPDIFCNKEIKFKAFLDYAFEQGADAIATGHYAQISSSEDQNQKQLLKGQDLNKDQSYFLYTLNQKQLANALFPIGHMTKDEVRTVAKENDLANYAKKDSTGICFIGERRFKSFLNEYLLAKPGKIQTTENKTIGQHDGLMFYTLGQRQGLKIGGQKNASEAPWYVVAKDIMTNTLIVAQEHNHPLLLSNRVILKQTHWINNQPQHFKCKGKTRYRQKDQSCEVTIIDNDSCEILFDEPQWAVTPGQSLVLYHNNVCLGGGVIDNVVPAGM